MTTQEKDTSKIYTQEELRALSFEELKAIKKDKLELSNGAVVYFKEDATRGDYSKNRIKTEVSIGTGNVIFDFDELTKMYIKIWVSELKTHKGKILKNNKDITDIIEYILQEDTINTADEQKIASALITCNEYYEKKRKELYGE